jgi:hypothetical protein
MTRVTRTTNFENELSSMIDGFFHTFGIVSILKHSGAYKKPGIPVVTIFQKLFSLVFSGRSMFMSFATGIFKDFGKDVFYRFLNSQQINWLRFTSLLSSKIVNDLISKATNDDRVNVFIVDDTLYERDRSKKVELLSWVHDHARNICVPGFRLLTLGWSDGNTFMPVNGVLLSSKKKKAALEECGIDKRTCGYAQRELAVTKAPDVMLEMIKTAVKSGVWASHVLFDSWFSLPVTIAKLTEENLDVIAMVKKTSKTHYLHNGQMLPVTKIYQMYRKRRGRSKYLLSAEALMCDNERGKSIPVRFVFVRNRNKKKEYLVLISTDMNISEEEIIRIYGKRWDIEVFFKVCKSYLKLTGECRAISYDAMTAYVAVVFARYMMLAAENRIGCDERTLCELFYSVCDELPDIVWVEAFRILMDVFLKTASEKMLLTEDELESLLEAFMSALPETLKNKLLKCA